MDYELTLFDRIEVIKATNQKYDLENNAYLSFSGGKDSTILHYLLDMALPNNRIPRVFIDTGIEYLMIRDFVLKLAKNDDRFVIIKPTKPIKQTLEKYGYPFKSKQHSHNLAIYQHSGRTRCVRVYLGEDKTQNGKDGMFKCPNALRYQFTEDFKIKCSELCCKKMKKEPSQKWAKANNKTITITGMRREEGGARANLGCIISDGKGGIKKFHPLIKVDDAWEQAFIERERERERVEICDLYKPPYNLVRTGCKGCPFALHLQEELDTLERLLPNERKQCEFIWQPIYAEYRRLNYRLRKYDKISLFDEEE